jgi:hypothetical protein
MVIQTHLNSIQTRATALWQSSKQADQPYAFKAQQSPVFLVLLSFEAAQTEPAAVASELLTIALAEQACISVQGLSGISLFEMAAQASCNSDCHVYLNLDLLTIDAHAQDWGDFKIKPEQVEVQRDELTHAALFQPRLGFVLQVLKTALPTVMDMLREAQLSTFSATIGSTWGACTVGQASLNIYRDAKQQALFSAQDLLKLKTLALTK